MSDRNIYAPAKFKDFLTCARVKSIAKYIDDFDDNPCGGIELYFTNERKDLELDLSSFKDSLNIVSKGYIIVTKSELVKETEFDNEIVFTITQDNIDEVRKYMEEFDGSDDYYLYQELSASLYLTDITITDKNNVLIAHIKDVDSEMTLIRGFEPKENKHLDEYAYLRNRVFEYGFKNFKASCKRTISHYNLDKTYEYIINYPCKTCEDTCCDYDWGKPVEIEYGWIPYTLSDVDKTLVLDYIHFIKSEIEKSKDYIVNYRKEKGRIDFYTVKTASYHKETLLCRYFGAIAYYNAINELGLKVNYQLLKNKVIKEGLLWEEPDVIDLQEFIDFGNSFGIDVIKELEIPKYLMDLYHKNDENLE